METLCFRKDSSHCHNYDHRFFVALGACDPGWVPIKTRNKCPKNPATSVSLEEMLGHGQGLHWASSGLELYPGSKRSRQYLLQELQRSFELI